MLERDLVSEVAAAFKTDESYVEKDWHIVRALGVIAGVAEEGVRPVFSGGTALLTRLVPAIAGDPLWRGEYDRFVPALAYASEAEAVDFDRALALCGHLVDRVLAAQSEA